MWFLNTADESFNETAGNQRVEVSITTTRLLKKIEQIENIFSPHHIAIDFKFKLLHNNYTVTEVCNFICLILQ